MVYNCYLNSCDVVIKDEDNSIVRYCQYESIDYDPNLIEKLIYELELQKYIYKDCDCFNGEYLLNLLVFKNYIDDYEKNYLLKSIEDYFNNKITILVLLKVVSNLYVKYKAK